MAATNRTLFAMQQAARVGGPTAAETMRRLAGSGKQKQPAVPPLTTPSVTEEQQAAEAAASQAVIEQRRRSRQAQGRSSTLLTRPTTLGRATTQRATLLGL